MKKTTHFGTVLILLIGFFANTAMGQITYTWNGSTSTDWATPANWTPSSGTSYPGTVATDIVVINNNSTPFAPIFTGTQTIGSLTVSNAVGTTAGATLNIASGTLTVSNASLNVVTLAGGNIINEGTLNITSTNAGASQGILLASAIQVPGLPTEFGYSGVGTLSVNIATAAANNSAALFLSANSANTTYKMLFNSATTTFTLGSNAGFVTTAIRAAAATGALAAVLPAVPVPVLTPSPLIIGGTGFKLGTALAPVRGGLITMLALNSVTINPGTTLESYSLGNSLNHGINIANAVASGGVSNPTFFTNKGTINILGESLRSGITAGITSTAVSQDMRINIVNDGIINVDLACLTPSVTNPTGFVWSGQAAYQQQQSNFGSIAGVFITNNGVLTLKNSSTVALTGYAIWGSGAGQRLNTNFTNNGSFNIDGSINSIAQGFTLTNNGIVNSNNSFAGFPAVNNNATGSINLIKTPAIFTVLAPSAATAGATYTDGNLNLYTVRTTKVNGTGTQILASTAPIAAIPATGTLSIASGTGDATIDYSAVTGIAATALSSPTINSGTISTGEGVGNLNIISSATFTLNSTSVLDPGGSSGKGITNISKASLAVPVLGTIRLQVAGSAVAGVDYDQITNSASGGGFDISGAILDITSLYSPSSNVVIPIVTASGTGTISGNFASVTGLTPEWTLNYSSTAVNLVFTIASIPITPTIWTGVAADNNFFNEANWKDSVSNVVPAAGSINPGVNINLALQINVSATITASGSIQFGTGSLALGTTVGAVNLTATSLSGGTVTINEGGYLALSSATPLLNNVQINFTSGIGWIKTTNYKASAISAGNLGQIRVNNVAAVYQSNLRLDQYYLNGCIIRANLAATTPLTVYDSANLGGSSAAITVNTVHSNSAITNNMNNKIESFLLKKGFMVTVAIENDGTGKSKNYIASEADLVINVLPQTLQNSISFIRVMPWNWVTKKGFNAPVDSNLDVSWRYQWNPNDSSTLDWEFAPMAWGHTSANDPADIALFIGKYNSLYVMSFNEPDDCDAQSGQYGDLCQINVAVGYHKNLMKTGMRIVSPGGREEAPKTGQWLESFMNEAKKQDVRIDVIAVHWYDWGSNPAVNTNPDPAVVAQRFIDYLEFVHNKFGLPIWITEFNANPARSQAINAEFLRIVLPQLESLDYIERYCWFPFNTGTHFTTGWDEINRVPTNTIPSLVGTIYKNINNTTPVNSTPAIPEATVNADNSLDLSSYPNVALNKPAIASSNLTNLGPDKAVDGDKTTSTSRWVVELATLPAWIEVDLQGSFLVDSFRITEDVNTVKDFRFEVWDATLNSGAGGWATALTVAGNPATTPLNTFKRITPLNTTKVRLFVTAHNATDRMRIFELEVFGIPSSPVWTGNTSTSWTTASNWSTSIVPSQSNNVLINGGATFQPTISASTTINSLTIATGATLTVTAPNLTVKGAIDNDGTMSLANNSNLLQGEEFNPNSGNVSINRNSSALNRLDYTIWSSPVENQNLAAFSPATSLNRFYNYNQTSNLYNAIANPATTAFGLAAGHLIRMPNTHPTTATVWNGTFTGVPNNGTITRVVTYRNEDPFNFGYNMIGNPYPSTLNANAFIAENTTKIENILYFWRKTNAALGSAYATWINGIGGTASGAGSAVPNGTIQVGQGFFVRAKPGTNLTLLTFNQTLTFKNAMRLGNTSTQFFKTKQDEKDRLWLNLTNTAGVFSQALIGYIPEATIGVDDFDGRYINDSPIALTSNINNEEYTIQGRPTFDPSDVVALNFKTDVAGDYTIAIDHLDGVFANGQDVYLVDSKTGTETDLKATAYNFTAVAGIDNARFSLKYQKTLKVDATAFNENSVKVYKNNGLLYATSGDSNISNIKVFDIQGRLIAEQKNLQSTTVIIKNLPTTNQVLIVEITSEDNNVVAKKIIN
jgi:hypothetical protein